MHVVVAGWLLDPTPSGANRRLLAILRAIGPLLEQGEQVTVLHRRGALPPDPPGDMRWQPIDIPLTPTWRRVLAERRVLRHRLESLAANLLELGSVPVPPRLPCPVSLTLHDLRDLEGWRGRPRLLVRHVFKQAMRRVACVTVPSAFTAEHLREAMGGLLPPVQIIPGGVDESFLRVQRQPRGGRPYFLHVGHLEPRKNLMMLLSAYAVMQHDAGVDPDRLPALYLAGADQGAGADLGERTAMLNLAGHVHFLGSVEEGDLRELYAGATALLSPSLHEGFGLPALEGLAAGLPVLVSDRGALPEVVGDAGTVLPAQDPQAWARAMAELLAAGEELPSVETRRRQRATRFTWAAAGERTLELWRDLCR